MEKAKQIAGILRRFSKNNVLSPRTTSRKLYVQRKKSHILSKTIDSKHVDYLWEQPYKYLRRTVNHNFGVGFLTVTIRRILV